MAINPHSPQINTVQNIEAYLDELFTEGPVTAEGTQLPGFYEFLENMRGIPRETFSKSAYEMLALQSEMGYYTMFVSTAMDKANKAAQSKASDQQQADAVKQASYEELFAYKNALNQQIEMVDTQLKAIASESAATS